MTAVIIDKRDVDIIAKELLKEIFDYFNNEEAIEDYREKEKLEKTRKEFFHKICLNYIFHIRIKNNFKCDRIDKKIVDKIILEESYDLNIVNEAIKLMPSTQELYMILLNLIIIIIIIIITLI